MPSACLSLIVLLAVALPASVAASPGALAHSFFRELNHRHWDEACGLMLPTTQRFVARHQSCPEGLLAAFRFTYGQFSFSTRHWDSARIASAETTSQTRTGVALSFRLAERYRCVNAPRKRPCARRIIRLVRPERLFFARDGRGRWRISKVGGVLEDMRLWGPELTEAPLFPPIDAMGLSQPATMPAPSFTCEGTTVAEVPGDRGDVTGPSYETIRSTPWLDVLGLRIVRTAPDAVCVGIALSQPPHPDSAYWVFWHRPEGARGLGWTAPNGQTLADQGAPAGLAEPNVEIAIDGDGLPHALINEVGAVSQPRVAAHLPQFGYAEGELRIELTPRQGFTTDRQWEMFAQADAAPSWVDPLLPHRLSGYDRIPGDECVTYPSGAIAEEFFCQGPSG